MAGIRHDAVKEVSSHIRRLSADEEARRLANKPVLFICLIQKTVI